MKQIPKFLSKCVNVKYSKEERRRDKVIVCVVVDDNNGMMFNQRRQSKDRILREQLLKMSEGSTLWMNEFTEKQFHGCMPAHVIVDNDLLEKAGESDYCFIEDLPLQEYENKISKLVIFKWNRVYPADKQFDISLTEWTLETTEEFEGSSHKLITKEVWIRGEKDQ